MTAELWLYMPCEHGEVEPHRVGFMPVKEYGEWELGEKCLGGSRVRLDPDRVVFSPQYEGEEMPDLTVQDVLDALEERHESA